MGRRVCRVDGNQAKVVKQLRKIGCSVLHTHILSHGAPDIIVGYKGVNYMIEIKDPSQYPSARQLTSDEVEFHFAWGGQIMILETIDDFLKLIKK